MTWQVIFHPAFELEFDSLAEAVQDEMLAQTTLLEKFGPQLGRPRVDTLKGSKHANIKELRFHAAMGEWRSRSTEVVARCCWWRETNRAAASGDSTAS